MMNLRGTMPQMPNVLSAQASILRLSSRLVMLSRPEFFSRSKTYGADSELRAVALFV